MPPTLVPRRNPDNDRDKVVVPLARAPVPDGPRQAETSALAGRTFDRRWVVVSILAHLAIIGALMFGLLEAPRPAPLPVLKITVVPRGPGGEGISGGADAAVASMTNDAAAAAEPIKPEIPTPAPEPIAPPTPAKPEMPPPQPVQPEIPKPTPVTPEIQPPSPSPVTTPPPVKATAPPQLVMEIPPPKPRRVPPRRQAARHSEPRPQLTPTPAPPAQTQTALATPDVGAGPGKDVEGAGKGAIGNSPGPGDDYLEKLYRHLLRYKKYPPEAISAKQQGSVTVAFTIARDGAVSDVNIERSSGSAALDEATLALVKHASPMPALPDSYKGNAARVNFPIDYKLSLIDQMF